MKTGVTVLGSGSSGNALVIHTEDSAILVDAGFSRKEILSRLEKANIDPAIIKGLLITHEHGDHVKGARVLADHLDIPTYVTRKTFAHLQKRNFIGKKVSIFDSGTAFELENFSIKPFAVPHDAAEPVGFTFIVGDFKIGVVTDLGYVDNLAKTRLMECDFLILECNHDIKMVKESDRTINLKRRILGRFGHLNNEDAINALDELIHEKTKQIIFYHLSGECNREEKVANLANAKLAALKREDISFYIAKQKEPLKTLWL